MTNPTPVKTILCTSDLPGGHTLSAAEAVDGRLGIYLDGELSDSAGRWDREEVEACIRTYFALRWERRLHGAGGGEGAGEGAGADAIAS